MCHVANFVCSYIQFQIFCCRKFTMLSCLDTENLLMCLLILNYNWKHWNQLCFALFSLICTVDDTLEERRQIGINPERLDINIENVSLASELESIVTAFCYSKKQLPYFTATQNWPKAVKIVVWVWGLPYLPFVETFIHKFPSGCTLT